MPEVQVDAILFKYHFPLKNCGNLTVFNRPDMLHFLSVLDLTILIKRTVNMLRADETVL